MSHHFWHVTAASVRGSSHHQADIPCQDASAVKTSTCGNWAALVASDGAGTAAHSAISSRLIATQFAEALLEIAALLDQRPPGAWIVDAVISHIVELRKQLREVAKSDDLSAYHCTLVAALIGPTGGFTIHIGDGAVFGAATNQSSSSSINLACDYFVSLPENGEFANETVFITERDWIKHIRIQHIAAPDWLVLGTDGGMALAMVGDQTPKSGFVAPILNALVRNPDRYSRDDALKNILSDRQADRLTNDDKTLVVAARSCFKDVDGEFITKKTPLLAPTAKSSNQFVKRDSGSNMSMGKDSVNINKQEVVYGGSFFQKKSFKHGLIILSLLIIIFFIALYFALQK